MFCLDLRPFSIVAGQLTERDYDLMDEARRARDNARLMDSGVEDVNDDIPFTNCHLLNRQSLRTRLLNIHARYPIEVAGQLYSFNDLE